MMITSLNLAPRTSMLAELLTTSDIDAFGPDLLHEAGFEYACTAVRLLIDEVDAQEFVLDDFREDFESMNLYARVGTFNELVAIAHHVLTECTGGNTTGLAEVLEGIQETGLLGELGMYRVTRWLAELLWSGPERTGHGVHADPVPAATHAETALAIAALACRSLVDPHGGLDDYIRAY